jgi:hypothetical protein
MHRQDPAILVG